MAEFPTGRLSLPIRSAGASPSLSLLKTCIDGANLGDVQTDKPNAISGCQHGANLGDVQTVRKPVRKPVHEADIEVRQGRASSGDAKQG